MNQMAEEGKKELVTAINSCLFLWTGDSWRQVCTNCGVVTGTPNTLLCCWITHAEPSNLPSLTKIKFIAAITKLEKIENSSGEVQQQFGNNDIQRLRLAAWGWGQGDENIEVWSSNSPFVSKIGIQNSHKFTSMQSHLDYYIRGLYERKNKLPPSFWTLFGTFIAIHL